MSLLSCLIENDEWKKRLNFKKAEYMGKGQSDTVAYKNAYSYMLKEFYSKAKKEEIEDLGKTFHKKTFNETVLSLKVEPKNILKKIAGWFEEKYKINVYFQYRLNERWFTKFKTGKVFINTARATLTTPIQSFGYLFLEGLKQENKEYYDYLLNHYWKMARGENEKNKTILELAELKGTKEKRLTKLVFAYNQILDSYKKRSKLNTDTDFTGVQNVDELITNDENFKRDLVLYLMQNQSYLNEFFKEDGLTTGEVDTGLIDSVVNRLLKRMGKDSASEITFRDFSSTDLNKNLTLGELTALFIHKGFNHKYEQEAKEAEKELLKLKGLLNLMKAKYLEFLNNENVFKHRKAKTLMKRDDEEIRELLAVLKTESSAEQVMSVMQKALLHLRKAEYKFNEMKDDVGNDISFKYKFEELLKLNLTNEEEQADFDRKLNRLNETLNELKFYLHLYSQIKEFKYLLETLDVAELFSEEELETLKKDIDGVIGLNANLSSSIKHYMTKLTAKWLYKFQKEANIHIERTGHKNAKKDMLNEDDIYNELILANKDISLWSYAFDATINNSDIISSLVMTALNEKDAKIEFAVSNKLSQLMHEFEKAGIKGKYTTESKLEEYYKENFLVKKKTKRYEWRKGEKIAVEEEFWALKTEFNEHELFNDYQEYSNSINEDEGLTDKEKAMLKSRYKASLYTVNKEGLAFIETVRKYRDGEITKEEFELQFKKYAMYSSEIDKNIGKELEKENKAIALLYTINNATYLKYYRLNNNSLELIEKYRNKDFNKAVKNLLYKELYDTYLEANIKLLYNKRLKFGRVPNVEKEQGLIDELSSVKEKVKTIDLTSIFKKKEQQEEESEEAKYMGKINLSGTKAKSIPVKYVGKQTDDINLNIGSTIFEYFRASKKYEELDKIDGNIQSLVTILQGDDMLGVGRRVSETNADGNILKKVYTLFSNDDTKEAVQNRIIKEGTSNADKALIASIEQYFYEIPYWEDVNFQLLLIGKVSAKKADAYVKKYTAWLSMGLRLDSGLSNFMFGHQAVLKEAMSKKYYNWENFRKAEKIMARYYLLEAAGGLNEQEEKIIKTLMMRYKAIQGDFTGDEAGALRGFELGRKAREMAFIAQSKGEETIGMVEMLSILDAQGIDLFVEYKLIDNKIVPSTLTEKQEVDISSRTQFMSKFHHGIYAQKDALIAKKMPFFSHFMMFRNHIYNAFKYRYMKTRYDYEARDYVEGYYRTFVNSLIEKGFSYVQKALTSKEGLTESEIYAFRKTMFDLLFIAAMFLFVMGLAYLEDDDDDDWVFDQINLLFTKMLKETIGYLPPANILDSYRLVTAPLTFRAINAVGSFTRQMFDPLETYEQRYGVFDKGDSMLLAKFIKMVLLMKSFVSLMTPEEQTKYFNSFFGVDVDN